MWNIDRRSSLELSSNICISEKAIFVLRFIFGMVHSKIFLLILTLLPINCWSVRNLWVRSWNLNRMHHTRKNISQQKKNGKFRKNDLSRYTLFLLWDEHLNYSTQTMILNNEIIKILFMLNYSSESITLIFIQVN